MTDAVEVSCRRRRMTWLRMLGRGASGAVVSLFAAGEELIAVKSAAGAEQLRREGAIMASLRSPHVLPCLGFRAAAGGEYYQLLLEFAPGGSLADEAARNGGRLEKPAVRAFAADVARGIAYLHDQSVVHGDVKARNVLISADGHAKLADFGCARRVGSNSTSPIGGTPAFMAPEVARGEEQGPPADVWALGCTVIEMATGRAPWTDTCNDVVAAVRRIGYTDAVPDTPVWLSADAKDFLGKCLCRRASDRWTAAQLLAHPFLAASTGHGVRSTKDAVKPTWVSPKSTLDAALWELDADNDRDDDDDDDLPETPADRIRSLVGPRSALPEWESDDGWIEACRGHSERSYATAAATSSEQTRSEVLDPPVPSTTHSGNFREDETEPDLALTGRSVAAEPSGADQDAGEGDAVRNAEAAGDHAHRRQQDTLPNFSVDPGVLADDHNVPDEAIVKACFPQAIRVCRSAARPLGLGLFVF